MTPAPLSVHLALALAALENKHMVTKIVTVKHRESSAIVSLERCKSLQLISTVHQNELWPWLGVRCPVSRPVELSSGGCMTLHR